MKSEKKSSINLYQVVLTSRYDIPGSIFSLLVPAESDGEIFKMADKELSNDSELLSIRRLDVVKFGCSDGYRISLERITEAKDNRNTLVKEELNLDITQNFKDYQKQRKAAIKKALKEENNPFDEFLRRKNLDPETDSVKEALRKKNLAENYPSSENDSVKEALRNKNLTATPDDRFNDYLRNRRRIRK